MIISVLPLTHANGMGALIEWKIDILTAPLTCVNVRGFNEPFTEYCK